MPSNRELTGSFLVMTVGGRQYQAKVIEFSSDVTSNIISSQTQRALHHFPFKVNQPTLALTLQMRDKTEAEYFQKFVRLSQVESFMKASLVNLFWPQRGMMDWKGAVLSVQAGERVGTTTPIIMIELILVDSMVSSRTWASSTGTDFEQIYAGEIPDIPLLDPGRPSRGQPGDPLLKPPRPITDEGKPIQGPYLGPDGNWY